MSAEDTGIEVWLEASGRTKVCLAGSICAKVCHNRTSELTRVIRSETIWLMLEVKIDRVQRTGQQGQELLYEAACPSQHQRYKLVG